LRSAGYVPSSAIIVSVALTVLQQHFNSIASIDNQRGVTFWLSFALKSAFLSAG